MDPGTHGEPEIEVRPPLSGRLFQVAVACAGAWLALIVTITLAGRGTLWAALAAGALLVWVFYFYRLISMVVVVRGDVLTVRNLLRTRHFRRGAISMVTLGSSTVAKAPNQTVVITTADGRQVPLEACARSIQSRRKQKRVEDFQRRLAVWSAASEGPAEATTGGELVAGSAAGTLAC